MEKWNIGKIEGKMEGKMEEWIFVNSRRDA